MKKLIFLVVIILLTTGCSLDSENVSAQPNVKYIQDRPDIYLYVDKETCVEYLFYTSHGGLIPRYNSDGSLKLNDICKNEINSGGFYD